MPAKLDKSSARAEFSEGGILWWDVGMRDLR